METTAPTNIPHITHEPLSKYQDTVKKQKNGITLDHLLEFKKSPRHYLSFLDDKELQKKYERQGIINEAISLYFLNQEDFGKQYYRIPNAALPEQNRGFYKGAYERKANLKFRDETIPTNFPGRIAMFEAEYDAIIDVCKPNINNEIVKKFYRHGQTALSSYMKDEKTGLELNGRVNFLPENKDMALFAFHITKDCSIEKYPKTLFYSNINNMLAWDMLLFNRTKAVVFTIEDHAPYILQPYVLDMDTRHKSLQENRMLIDLLFWCKKTNFWPDYAQFWILKNIYQNKYCFDMDIKDTFDILSQFWELNTGFFNIELPKWMR